MSDENKGVDWSASVAIELKEKIEELENRLSSSEKITADSITTNQREISLLKKRIAELEKKYDLILLENVATTTYINRAEKMVKAYQNAYENKRKNDSKLKEEIAELRNKLDVWRNEANNILNELKWGKDHNYDYIRNLDDNVISNLKEVLRELIKLLMQEFNFVDIDIPIGLEKILAKLDVRSAAHTEYECISCGRLMKKGELCPICKPPENKLEIDPYQPYDNLNEPREDDKELYELYLKDNDQYYFKKITHPFTEYNNMVNLGIGEMKVKREDLQFLCERLFDHQEYEDVETTMEDRERLNQIKKVNGIE